MGLSVGHKYRVLLISSKSMDHARVKKNGLLYFREFEVLLLSYIYPPDLLLIYIYRYHTQMPNAIAMQMYKPKDDRELPVLPPFDDVPDAPAEVLPLVEAVFEPPTVVVPLPPF